MRNTPVLFDGTRWHMTTPFTGERWVLTAYSMPNVNPQSLKGLGFPSQHEQEPAVKRSRALDSSGSRPEPHQPVQEQAPPLAPSKPQQPVHASKAWQSEVPMIVELFAGRAMLLAVARERGYSILPVDHDGNKHRAYAHIVRLDLRNASSRAYLRHLVELRVVLRIHMRHMQPRA